MIVIVDERETVLNGYTSWFCREGVSATGLAPQDFRQWVNTAPEPDIDAVEAFLLGDFQNREDIPVKIKSRTAAAIIAMNDTKSLNDTLELFAAGVDDVVRKPVHVREILARIKAIARRNQTGDPHAPLAGRIRVFSDGRDPEIDGEPLPLPRRERRILEYLMANKGRRVTKSQIFNFVYGLFDDGIDENVIESHISKLRKRLRQRLGTDPIDSQRFLGYRLTHE
jgi:DNA-binding response OmpR family regulator